jgi:Fe-S cluster assembly protein SufD
MSTTAALPLLAGARREALERFRASGFPTPKVEAWKFTNLNRLAAIAFKADAATPTLTREAIAPYRLSTDCPLIAVVNGRFRPELSDLTRLPKPVRIADLDAASEDDLRAIVAPLAVPLAPKARALADLNLAEMSGGAIIHIADDAGAAPIQLLSLALPGGQASVFHQRNLIRLEANASATVVESYVALGDGAYWTNVVTQVVTAAGARLRHHRLQTEGTGAFHVGTTSVRVERDASYRMFAASIGGELARHEIDVALAAPGAQANLTGITLARGEQHLDTTIRVDHDQPHGTSNQEFRSVVADRGHSVFQGAIRVAPDAQKTDARQLNHNLLLSAEAAADTKPELEILADDVKCSHGASVGDLDKDSMFYLRARGIGEREARALLIEGFIAQLLESVDDGARGYFRRAVDLWLAESLV